MTDITVAQHTRPQALQPVAEKRMQVRGKLAAAIDRMVELGEPYNDAARNAGLTTRAIRKALDKPHVIAYLRQRKQVLRERMSASNILRLAQIRDAADNMPAVNAIKVLEQIGDDNPVGSGTSQRVPGVVVNIIHPPANAPLALDHAKPLRSHEAVRDDD